MECCEYAPWLQFHKKNDFLQKFCNITFLEIGICKTLSIKIILNILSENLKKNNSHEIQTLMF